MANSCWLSRAQVGGDAGSLTPRCSATRIRCISRAAVSTKTSLPHLVRTTTTTRVVVQTRGLVVHRFVSCIVVFALTFQVNRIRWQPQQMALLRAACDVGRGLALGASDDAARLVAHRGGPHFGSQT